MGKVSVLAFGFVAYATFVASIVWAMAFLGNLWLPLTIDSPPRTAALGAAVVDLAILALFAVQHSVMARPWFKTRWTRLVPAPAERSVYVLSASAILMLLFALWQPIGGVLWSAVGALRTVILVAYWVGWAIVVASTFQISHFELFGLRQVWAHWKSVVLEEWGDFRIPWMYAIVRHPMMFGTLIAFWASPVMTVGHLLFALAASAYIVVGTTFEERDLIAVFGTAYTEYRKRTPMLIPFPRRRG